MHEGSPSIRHCLWYDNYNECLLFRNGVTGLDVREAGHDIVVGEEESLLL